MPLVRKSKSRLATTLEKSALGRSEICKSTPMSFNIFCVAAAMLFPWLSSPNVT